MKLSHRDVILKYCVTNLKRPAGKRIALSITIFTLLVPLNAFAWNDDNPVQSEAAKRGQAQFAATCSFCHGSDAAGGTEGPNLLRSRLVRHDEKGNLIGPVIRDGRPAKGMPAFSLSESQIADVVAFLHWRLTEGDRTTPADPRDLSLAHLLTGNAKAGQAFFEGAGGCTSCHSLSKDLAGIAKKYSPAELQARFLYPSDVPKTATITTHSGEQISGELVYQDLFSIAIKDHHGWYHSWPLSEVAFQIQDPLAAHMALLHKYSEADIHNLFAYLETAK